MSVLFGVFSVSAAQAHPVAVTVALREMPQGAAWFADEKALRIDSRALIGNAAQMPIKIGRVYSVLPAVNSPEFEFLADDLAVNLRHEFIFSLDSSHRSLSLTTPSTGSWERSQAADFRDKLIKRIREIRGDKSGVHITLLDSAAGVFKKVNHSDGSGIIFSDDLNLGGAISEGVVAIHNTSIKPDEVVAGLAAGMKELMKTQRKIGWRSLSDLLAGYLELVQRVQALVSTSA
jgi:hypothetical protein